MDQQVADKWSEDYSEAQCAVLKALLNRRSAWPLVEPAPSKQELDLVFDIGLRAPDHGHLRPWRFVVIEGNARGALGEVLGRAAQHLDANADVQRVRAKVLMAPVIIALGVHVVPARKVPAQEQLLAVGAATMNMLNALEVLGYGGFWASGVHVYEPMVRQALGFEADDVLIGFLYVGTRKGEKKCIERLDRSAYVRYWYGS